MSKENVFFEASYAEPIYRHAEVRRLKRIQAFKLGFDRLVVLLLFPVICAALLLIALLVKVDSKGPIIFRQKRHGLEGTVFWVSKFRTMHVAQNDPSGAQQTTAQDKRVTRMGRILRRTCLDELPQVWDVFRGQMSLVGPRPHPVGMVIEGKKMDALYPDYANRLRLRPGMTGLSQVNGNRGPVHDIEFGRQRLDFDRKYIENWSLWLDIKILVQTIVLPFKRGSY